MDSTVPSTQAKACGYESAIFNYFLKLFMKNYKLLIFDWDGTLANSMDFIVECLKATAREFGVAEGAK